MRSSSTNSAGWTVLTGKAYEMPIVCGNSRARCSSHLYGIAIPLSTPKAISPKNGSVNERVRHHRASAAAMPVVKKRLISDTLNRTALVSDPHGL